MEYVHLTSIRSPARALQSYSDLPADINPLHAPHRLLNRALLVGKSSFMVAIITRIARCDTGRADTIMYRDVNDLASEEGVTRLRHAREEARFGVGSRIETEGS